MQIKKEYLLIASFLFIFSLQQAIEGLVWLSWRNGDLEDIQLFSKIFLSFSHLIWLLLAPLSVALLEPSPSKKRCFCLFAAFGLMFGCSIYLPLILYNGWLDVNIARYSIFYDVRLIYDPFLSKDTVGLIYATIIVLPMFMSGNRHVRFFGAILFISGLFSGFSYYYAFISVWCFFAGILSLYIAYMLWRVSVWRPIEE